MKIGIVASVRHHIGEPFAGGLEMHTYLLAARLRARGHQVIVFASASSDPSLGVEPISASGGAPVFSRQARQDVSMLAQPFMEEHHAYLSLMLRLQKRCFDVVHNNALHYLPVAMAAALPCPFVTTLHTPPTPWLESAIACGRAFNASYVSVSHSNAHSWKTSLSASGASCEVIPNGIDLDRWTYHPAAETGRAAWSGRVVPEKGAHLAVEAAHAAGLHIVLAGPLHDRAYFDREVAPRLGPGDAYAGHLDHDALSALIGHAEVFLCTPCWDEPYGLVVAEALACGTPVAAFDRGAMSEILDERTGRLATPGDAEALGAAALEALRLRRPDCRRRAEAHCSAQVMIDRYEALYTRLAA